MSHIDPYNPLDLEALGQSLLRELERHEIRKLTELMPFAGSGIYALYYTGKADPYTEMGDLNRRRGCQIPLYVGRSKDSGARQGLSPFQPVTNSVLFSRVKEHKKSIESAANLEVKDFAVRVLVVMPIWIPLAETMAIRQYQPLWNSHLQGFGIHAPGKGRVGQRQSQWDALHPGRAFAHALPKSAAKSQAELLARLREAVHAAVSRHSLVEQDIVESTRQPPARGSLGQRSQSGASPRPRRR